ncbi:hypothetical protein [Microbulbifer sp. Q7]|uniref:hypothetical protein n=1 Tax=Microbulbifer sp. Q7 TaxID=1785091 RepID=UPI000833CB1D|nr:hypothetical protein [Microbulbifer sp. Q7]
MKLRLWFVFANCGVKKRKNDEPDVQWFYGRAQLVAARVLTKLQDSLRKKEIREAVQTHGCPQASRWLPANRAIHNQNRGEITNGGIGGSGCFTL